MIIMKILLILIKKVNQKIIEEIYNLVISIIFLLSVIMSSSIGQKRTNIKQLTVKDIKQYKKQQRDFDGQMVCGKILRQILEKAQNEIIHHIKIDQFIQKEKQKESQKFSINNTNKVLQNYYIQHQCLSPKMNNQASMNSPSKSPFSFLNYQQLAQETERQQNNQMINRQRWQQRRDSKKIPNCNKIFIIKKSQYKNQLLNTLNSSTIPNASYINHNNSFNNLNSSIKSIQLNQTMPGGFGGRLSHKQSIKKISINHNAFIPRLSSRGRLTANPFSPHKQSQSKNKYLQLKNIQLNNLSINRSSFYNQKQQDKPSHNHEKLIKLQHLKQPIAKDMKQKQTNDYITYLRQRKQKLQNIMKAFDVDDIMKINNKIQRQNLMRNSKTQNLAETYNQMPTVTTDYQGNLIYLQDNKSIHKNKKTDINKISQQQILTIDKSKSNPKYNIKLPKYQSNTQGPLLQNVTYKIKDIDDKTKNFLNQIFSSARGTPNKSNKKIMFNTNKDGKFRRNQNHLSSKISLVYEQKKYDQQKTQYSVKGSQSINQSRVMKNNISNQKLNKSSLKLPLKSASRVVENSIYEQSKQNINFQNNSIKIKTSQMKGRGILKSEPSYRQNKKGQNSLVQLQRVYRDGYAIKKQRIHPNLNKTKKVTTISTQEFQQNKIIQTSNQNTDRFNNQSPMENNSPLKKLFDILLNKTAVK